MYYVLKLFDVNSNMLIEGVYSTRSKVEAKANYYMTHYKERIRFYSIDLVPMDSQLMNEDIIEILYC